MSRGLPSEATRQKQMRTWALRTAVVHAAIRLYEARKTGNKALEKECTDELVAAAHAYDRREEAPPP